MFYFPLSEDNDFNSSRYRTLSLNLFNSPRFSALMPNHWDEIEKEFQDFYLSRNLSQGRNPVKVTTSASTAASSQPKTDKVASSTQTSSTSVFDNSFEDAFFNDFFKYRENRRQSLAQNSIGGNINSNSQSLSLIKPTSSDMNPLVIQTNIGTMSPGSISVKIENNILTISGEEKTASGFSKFNSARTLPPYIATHKLEEQIISKLNTSADGVRMLEIILPEEPKPAIEEKEENFKSDEIKIQIVGNKQPEGEKKDDQAE